MKAILVCVDYADILDVTLHRNSRFFDQILVVSTPRDTETAKVASRMKHVDVSLYNTTAFYQDGADFNKGLAIEEGFGVLGRSGWIAVIDADIVLNLDFLDLLSKHATDPEKIYGPYRRMCINPKEWNGGYDWSRLPRVNDREIAGYCQIFNASAAALRSKPWYGTSWTHAGGCDSEFQSKWPPSDRVRLPFDVLHLGPHGRNWHGRVTETVS